MSIQTLPDAFHQVSFVDSLYHFFTAKCTPSANQLVYNLPTQTLNLEIFTILFPVTVFVNVFCGVYFLLVHGIHSLYTGFGVQLLYNKSTHRQPDGCKKNHDTALSR